MSNKTPPNSVFLLAGLKLRHKDYRQLFILLHLQRPLIIIPANRNTRTVIYNYMRALPIKIFPFLAAFTFFLMCNNSKNEVLPDRKENICDIAILIDVSVTMQSKDFQPNRMMAIRNKVEQMINQKNDNQSFSIIVFAGNSYILSPLKQNKSELQKSLKKVDFIWKNIRFGTNYSDAFLNGIYSLENSTNNKKIIIFSDGESNIKNSQLQFVKDAIKNYQINVNSILLKPKEYEIIPKGIDKNAFVFEKIPAKPLDSTLIKISTETNGVSFVFHTDEEFNKFDIPSSISNSDSDNFSKSDIKFDKSIYNIKFKKLQKTTDSINLKLKLK